MNHCPVIFYKTKEYYAKVLDIGVGLGPLTDKTLHSCSVQRITNPFTVIIL